MDGPAPHPSWRFGRFVFDPSNGGLFRLSEAGTRELVPIGGRALDVLATLVTDPGQVLLKQTIMDAVWPGLSVEEKNLAVQISTLRRVLDEGRSGASCIQTVPGRGYRFTPEISNGAEPRPDASAQARPEPAQRPAATSFRRGRLVITGLVLAVLILAVGVRALHRAQQRRPRRIGASRSSFCRSRTAAATPRKPILRPD